MNDNISKEKREKFLDFLEQLIHDFTADPRFYIDLKHYALSKEVEGRKEDVICAVLDYCLAEARNRRKETDKVWKNFPNFA